MNLLNNVNISEGYEPISLSSSIDSNTDILDMSGYDGVVFITPIEDSVATGVATLNVQQNTADSDTSMADLSGASAQATCTTTDDLNNLLLVVDVYKPAERYVQGVLTSATANIAFGTTIALRYKGSKAPIIQGATVTDSVSVFGPAEA